MESLTTATAAASATVKGAAASGVGASVTILGNMAGLTGLDWGILLFFVIGGVVSGSYIMQTEVEVKNGHDACPCDHAIAHFHYPNFMTRYKDN